MRRSDSAVAVDSALLPSPFYVSMKRVMETRYQWRYEQVAKMMEKPEPVIWHCNGFISAFTGTIEYGNDYEIQRLILSGWKQPFSRWVCDGAGRKAVSRAGPFFTLKANILDQSNVDITAAADLTVRYREHN